MKNYPPNFDQKIQGQNIPINMPYSSEANNNSIRELLNIIMQNSFFLNNLGPNINMVSLFIYYIIMYLFNIKIPNEANFNTLNLNNMNQNNNNYINFNNNLNLDINKKIPYNNPETININSNRIYPNNNNNINSIINTSNISNKNFTSLLCNKNDINIIKSLLIKNQYNIDLIRKIILMLNEENGLYIVFKNIYGNYFIQELFQKMNDGLIQLTIDLINSEFVNIAKSPYGTHALQELLNHINSAEMEKEIIKAIKYKEKEMAFDDNATYVLQKIIAIIPDKKRVRLNFLLIDNTKDLSLNANSVFVLKKFISTNTIEDNKKKFLYELKKNFLIISQNPFGNYVIQYIFDVWSMMDCEIIVNEIFGKVIDLSCQRFSSNIIKKSLNIFSNDYKVKLINIICFSPKFLILLKNKYGNFIVNKAVDNMDNGTKTKLKLYLTNHMKNNSKKDNMLISQIISLLKS